MGTLLTVYLTDDTLARNILEVATLLGTTPSKVVQSLLGERRWSKEDVLRTAAARLGTVREPELLVPELSRDLVPDPVKVKEESRKQVLGVVLANPPESPFTAAELVATVNPQKLGSLFVGVQPTKSVGRLLAWASNGGVEVQGVRVKRGAVKTQTGALWLLERVDAGSS